MKWTRTRRYSQPVGARPPLPPSWKRGPLVATGRGMKMKRTRQSSISKEIFHRRHIRKYIYNTLHEFTTLCMRDVQPIPHQGAQIPGSGLVHLHLYQHLTGCSGKALAKALGVSPAYASLMLAGARYVRADVQARLHTLLAAHAGLGDFQRVCLNLETRLGRALNEEELLALVPSYGLVSALLSALAWHADQGGTEALPVQGLDPQRTFDVSTALASLTSLTDILAEEPDLPVDQRQQFLHEIRQAAGRLTALVPATAAPAGPPTPTIPVRPDRFVDQVFGSAGYYFETLEREADLIVRRARRHGPLGSAALVARLEQDLGCEIDWQASPDKVLRTETFVPAATLAPQEPLRLDPSLGQAQLRFRLGQFLAAQEARPALDALVTRSDPPNQDCAAALRRALVAYTAAAMFMPYGPFLDAATQQGYDLDWLSRHFGCSFDQVCHRLITLRQPDQPGVPFGLLRVSPAGHTLTRIALPGLALPDQQAGCPLWAVYGALQRPGDTLTQLAAFPGGERFLLIARASAGPRTHHGQPRRLTSVMLACDWAYASALIYADAHDPGRPTSVSKVGSACHACPRAACESRVRPWDTRGQKS